MKYDWIDYTPEYKEIVDSWMDEDAKRFTGCDEGFDAYYQYWSNEPETKPGDNFWVKVIIADTIPVGVIAIGLSDNIFTISEIIVKPDSRRKGLGSSALLELLTHSEKIIGVKIKDANAVIFPNNTASQRVFEKTGFLFDYEHPDKDAWNYKYHNTDN